MLKKKGATYGSIPNYMLEKPFTCSYEDAQY